MSEPTPYTPPAIWQWNKENGGQFASINRPIAGATHDKELPVGKHPLQPLSVLRAQAAAPVNVPQFEKVNSIAELDARLAQTDRPVMLDFYADWCVSCKEMERFTFSDARVAERMGQMLLLKADVTANDDEHKALLKRFGLFGPPGIIFFDAEGKEREGMRVVGFMKAEPFATVLDRAL